MTSAQALMLTSKIIQTDLEVAGPLLLIVVAVYKARGDAMAEAMTRDVMKFLYSKTEHSEQGMEEFISEGESSLSHLAA